MTVDFLHYNSCVPRPIMVGGSQIDQVSFFKFLGFFVSDNPTWVVHCDYIVKKTNRKLYALKQLKKCGALLSDIVTIYCALIRSVIQYAAVMYAGLPQYLSASLENIQRRALSIIWPSIRYEVALASARLST